MNWTILKWGGGEEICAFGSPAFPKAALSWRNDGFWLHVTKPLSLRAWDFSPTVRKDRQKVEDEVRLFGSMWEPMAAICLPWVVTVTQLFWNELSVNSVLHAHVCTRQPLPPGTPESLFMLMQEPFCYSLGDVSVPGCLHEGSQHCAYYHQHKIAVWSWAVTAPFPSCDSDARAKNEGSDLFFSEVHSPAHQTERKCSFPSFTVWIVTAPLPG